jgi:Zn-finger nucleic acid-binding protein
LLPSVKSRRFSPPAIQIPFCVRLVRRWNCMVTTSEVIVECPVCKEPMIVLELDQVEVDYCTHCQGIWLDAGELELLLDDSAEKDAFLSSFEIDRGSGEKPRRCPICSKKMEKVLIGKEERICLDRCRKNDGIWFDRGELVKILRMSSFGKDRRVLELLRSMFDREITEGG